MRKEILNNPPMKSTMFTHSYMNGETAPDYLDCVEEGAQDVLAVLDQVNYHTAKSILERAISLLDDACLVDKTSAAFDRP